MTQAVGVAQKKILDGMGKTVWTGYFTIGIITEKYIPRIAFRTAVCRGTAGSVVTN